MGNNKYVLCPLVDEMIEDIDCIENADIADKMITEQNMLEKFKKKENWRDICKNCKWHNY